MIDFPELVRGAIDLGVLASLVMFFVWQGSRREDKLADRITSLEEYTREELSRMNADLLKALQEAAEVIKQNSQVISRRIERLDRLEALELQQIETKGRADGI